MDAGNDFVTEPDSAESIPLFCQSSCLIVRPLLQAHLPTGKVITECPISTSAGVKVADVSWISRERRQAQKGQKLFILAPEICVEVLSPSNTRAEIDEKRRLYFEAGAEEVWICGLDGTMRFFLRPSPDDLAVSALCPGFPERIESET